MNKDWIKDAKKYYIRNYATYDDDGNEKLLQYVRPAGIEPTSTVPKTGTLSVELRAHKNI